MNSTNAIIDIKDVCASYGASRILCGVSLTIGHNERWAIIGRNGAGKSTLIKLVAGLLERESGMLQIDNMDIRRYSSRKRARIMAYVPQKPDGIIPYSVHDFVMLGRYSIMGVLGVPVSKDRKAVHEALEICDVECIATRLMSTLSGGELQRVLLAGAVAQQTPLLLLDEPTTYLDPAHERLFFDALARLHEQRSLTIIMVTHDINTALAQCTHVGALLDGNFLFSGTTAAFAGQCPGILQTIYSVRFDRYVSDLQKFEAFGTWSSPCSK